MRETEKNINKLALNCPLKWTLKLWTATTQHYWNFKWTSKSLHQQQPSTQSLWPQRAHTYTHFSFALRQSVDSWSKQTEARILADCPLHNSETGHTARGQRANTLVKMMLEEQEKQQSAIGTRQTRLRHTNSGNTITKLNVHFVSIFWKSN